MFGIMAVTRSPLLTLVPDDAAIIPNEIAEVRAMRDGPGVQFAISPEVEAVAPVRFADESHDLALGDALRARPP